MFISDDFRNSTLASIWSREGPAGDVEVAAAAGEAFVTLDVPAGNFQAWNNNNALRLLQDASDEDFGVSTRFLSSPSQKNQQQGLLIEQDANNWLRFDVHYDGSNQRVFVGLTVDGVSRTIYRKTIPIDSAPYLSIERQGDTFVFAYSSDGQNWTTATSLDHEMTVTAAGPFAGTTTAAFTAQVDYVFNTASPIVGEDAGVSSNNPPVAQDDIASTVADTSIVLAIQDLLSNDIDPDGDALLLTGFEQPEHGSLVDNGDGTLTYSPTERYVGTDRFAYSVGDGQAETTAYVDITIDSAGPSQAAITSDDFRGSSLDGLWTLQGPQGQAPLVAAGGDAYVELVAPAGNHQAWNGNNSVRLMQAASDTNFEIEAHFLSTPTERYHQQGLLIEQDAGNWLRFDTHFDGNVQRVFGAITIDGSSTTAFRDTIATGGATYLRIERNGDLWTFDHSNDGNTWITAGSYTHQMTVTSAGPFAGTTSSAYTARVDYVFDNAAPIADEDAGVTSNMRPTAFDDTATTSADTPIVLAVADLLANDVDPENDPLSLINFGQPLHGDVIDNGDGTLTYSPDPSFSGDDRFSYTVSDGNASDTANVDLTVQHVGPIIDVWYGDVQTFGMPGEAQRWINILGDVPLSQVSGLGYSLNGGSERSLSLGPDNHRLDNPGDFNIDIDYRDLNPSAADDVVTIRATLASGQTVSQDVVVKYQQGHHWSSDYDIDWAQVDRLQDVVQVSDGLWTFDENGARPAVTGYDRVLVVGDGTWDSYEARIEVTAHDLTVSTSQQPGFAFGMLWDGHTDDPFRTEQPKAGWRPGASFFYRDNDGAPRIKLHDYASFAKVSTGDYALADGGDYIFKIRVEQTGLFDHTYKLKVWESGAAEPSNWLMQYTEAFSEPVTGSLYLNAHKIDVTFGDISVREIRGSDIVREGGGNDTITAVDLSDAAPGRGELDVLVGGGGADVFVLGDAEKVYYDDGVANDAGLDDYALLWDFTPGADAVELRGSAADYSIDVAGPGLPDGAAIYHIGAGAAEPELIAVLHGVSPGAVGDDELRFIPSDDPVA